MGGRKVKVILERIDFLVNDYDELPSLDEISFEGKVMGKEKIGDYSQKFYVSCGSVIGLVGKAWETVSYMDDDKDLQFELCGKNNESGGGKSNVHCVKVTVPKKERWKSGNAMLTETHFGHGITKRTGKGFEFRIHYCVIVYSNFATTTKVDACREHRGSNKFTKVVILPQVIIQRDGKDIDHTNDQILVGQKVNLSVRVTKCGKRTTKFWFNSWVISGVIVKGYGGNANNSALEQVDNLDYRNRSISFYWSHHAKKKEGTAEELIVRCTAGIGPAFLIGEAKLKVIRPSCEITVEKDVVRFKRSEDPGVVKHHVLIYGPGEKGYYIPNSNGGSTPGIGMSAVLNIPEKVDENVRNSFKNNSKQYVQRVKILHYVLDKKGNTFNWGTNSEWWLDKTYPYDTGWIFTDSPSLPLLEQYIGGSVKFEAQTFMMFKPEGKESIFVPLKMVKWNFIGQVAKKGNKWSTNDLDEKSTDTQHSLSITNFFPIWKKNAVTVKDEQPWVKKH